IPADIPIARLCFPAATATFLILPYAFGYDMTVACLGLFLTLHRNWERLTILERGVLGAAFMSPQLTILLSIAGLPLTPLLLLGGLAVQLRAEEFIPRQCPA